MDSQQQQLKVVLKIADAEILAVSQNQASVVEKGTLSLAEIPEHNCYLIAVGNFRYVLSSEIVVMGRKLASGETIYVLPNVEGYYGVKVPIETDSHQLEVFELIINQTCEFLVESEHTPEPQPEVKPEPNPPTSTFVIKKAADYNPNIAKETALNGKSSVKETCPARAPEKEKVKLSGKSPDCEEEKCEDQAQGNTTAKVSNTITKSGEVIRGGLIKAAEFTSGGITKAGQYLTTKFAKKQKNVEVKETTLNKIKLAQTSTNAVLFFTSNQIKGLISMAGMIGKELACQWESTDTSKKLEEKPAYQTAKVIGKSAIQATATVYDGMYEALCVIGRGVGKTTTNIVTQKYGEKMGDLTQGAFDCVGNVGLLAKVVPMETAKALATNTLKSI